MDWHTELDVSSWGEPEWDPRGRRTKFWVKDNQGQQWLRKEPLRAQEPLIEALTLHLAAQLGLQVAEGYMARWTANGETIHGFISRKLTDDPTALSSGANILEPNLPKVQNERQLRAASTLNRVLDALRKHNLVEKFLEYLVFDAWVGIGDRHTENWGLIQTAETVSLAPMFDTAGCLGSEMTDDRLPVEESQLNAYIKQCRSGFGDGERIPNVPMNTLLGQLQDIHEWPKVAPAFVKKICHLIRQLPTILDAPVLTDTRRTFITCVLKKRVKLLLRKSAT